MNNQNLTNLDMSTELSKTEQPCTIHSVMQRFISLGYELNYQDGNRYIELKKMFNNSDTIVNGADELQIGRFIEILGNNIISKPYMKRGWLWSGSAYTQKNKGNVYATGTERLIARF
jgi:hypothetical protein